MMAGPMVRRLKDGTKTQTRRTGKRWTKVKPGDVLHVREAFSRNDGSLFGGGVLYRADNIVFSNFGGWTPAVHMPLHLCRMRLLVKRVWQERADEISEADAIAEGMEGVTVEDLLEMAGGSKRLVINLLYSLQRSRKCSQAYLRESWLYFGKYSWPVMAARERFRLVLSILGAKPGDMVTTIEFEVRNSVKTLRTFPPASGRSDAWFQR